jgi:hypothetical protein
MKGTAMEHLTEKEYYVGLEVLVEPLPDDQFLCEFEGLVIGIRNGLLQVKDQADDVWEVEESQVTVLD